MRRGDMQSRIKLHRILTPQGSHQIFNPTHNEVKLIREVWAKHEDYATPSRWAMVTVNTIIRKQFIINHRNDLPEDMAVEHRGNIYTVLHRQELGGDKKWIILLVGRLGINENGASLFGL